MAETKIDVDSSADVQNRANEDFEFHDIPYDTSDSNRAGTQTHVFHDNPDTAESEEDEFDKSELLKEKISPSFWKFEYYQQFFDVDTSQVLERIVGSMLPQPRKNYLKTKIRPNPDLYGPFWICLTLVFTTAIAGNLANYLQSAEEGYVWRYDFHKVTFSATAIFAYWWLIPTGLVALLWWRKSDAGYSFLEILCVYGYSLAIYIPISILWVIQVNWLQWSLVIVGALLSGSVLLLTFWPAIRDDNKQIAWITMALIFAFHAALAVGFVLYFFHVPVATTLVPTTAASAVIPTKAPLPNATNIQLQAGAQNILQSGNQPGIIQPSNVNPPVGNLLASNTNTDQLSGSYVDNASLVPVNGLVPGNSNSPSQEKRSEDNSQGSPEQNIVENNLGAENAKRVDLHNNEFGDLKNSAQRQLNDVRPDVIKTPPQQEIENVEANNLRLIDDSGKEIAASQNNPFHPQE
ncbi:hypothetical protein ScPMuIL_005678 [Solemya velum]